MIFDAIPYADLSQGKGVRGDRAVRSFIDFLEERLGVRAIYDLRNMPGGRADLLPLMLAAEPLLKSGTVRSVYPLRSVPDEPPLKYWEYVGGQYSGGEIALDDEGALRAALMSSLKQYLWLTQKDYFSSPTRATTTEIGNRGPYITPETFTVFSNEQRAAAPAQLALRPEAQYLWVKAPLLTSERSVFIPAQTISRSHNPLTSTFREPLIKEQTPAGLGVHEDPHGAQLNGMLELLAHDAFMIMWLNQLTLPCADTDSLRGIDLNLDLLLDWCMEYRLKVTVIPMMTDAPTHTVAVVLEDMSAVAPKVTIGLSANQSLPRATKGALMNALALRRHYRDFIARGGFWDIRMPIETIGARDRLFYWTLPEHLPALAFLTNGPEVPYTFDAPWEKDSDGAHRERLLQWCKTQGLDCVSISMSRSAANPTPWFVEMVVIPGLQSLYRSESLQQLGGPRLSTVPTSFGYSARSRPFTELPHPYPYV